MVGIGRVGLSRHAERLHVAETQARFAQLQGRCSVGGDGETIFRRAAVSPGVPVFHFDVVNAAARRLPIQAGRGPHPWIVVVGVNQRAAVCPVEREHGIGVAAGVARRQGVSDTSFCIELHPILVALGVHIVNLRKTVGGNPLGTASGVVRFVGVGGGVADVHRVLSIAVAAGVCALVASEVAGAGAEVVSVTVQADEAGIGLGGVDSQVCPHATCPIPVLHVVTGDARSIVVTIPPVHPEVAEGCISVHLLYTGSDGWWGAVNAQVVRAVSDVVAGPIVGIDEHHAILRLLGNATGIEVIRPAIARIPVIFEDNPIGVVPVCIVPVESDVADATLVVAYVGRDGLQIRVEPGIVPRRRDLGTRADVVGQQVDRVEVISAAGRGMIPGFHLDVERPIVRQLVAQVRVLYLYQDFVVILGQDTRPVAVQ